MQVAEKILSKKQSPRSYAARRGYEYDTSFVDKKEALAYIKEWYSGKDKVLLVNAYGTYYIFDKSGENVSTPIYKRNYPILEENYLDYI